MNSLIIVKTLTDWKIRCVACDICPSIRKGSEDHYTVFVSIRIVRFVSVPSKINGLLVKTWVHPGVFCSFVRHANPAITFNRGSV